QASAGLNPVKVSVQIDLQQHRGVIGRSARGQGINTLKAQFAKIEFIDEHIDHPDWILFSHVIIETFGQQPDLSSAFALNETLHLNALLCNMPSVYHAGRFYTPSAVSGLGHWRLVATSAYTIRRVKLRLIQFRL